MILIRTQWLPILLRRMDSDITLIRRIQQTNRIDTEIAGFFINFRRKATQQHAGRCCTHIQPCPHRGITFAIGSSGNQLAFFTIK